MSSSTPPSTDLDSLVERQLRQWELRRRAAVAGDDSHDVFPFIAISRQIGAGAAEIAARIGLALHWPVFDRQILHAMADSDALRQRLYEGMDERDATWLERMLEGLLLDSRPHDYRRRLATTLLAIVRQGPAIILGRAADLILPRDAGLRVRIVAPLEQRIRRYATAHELDESAARRIVAKIDRDRSEFIRRRFRSLPDDPLRFDVIINTGKISLDAAFAVIVELAGKHTGRATERSAGEW